MTPVDQEMRKWFQEQGMILTDEQDAALRKWLADNDATFFAVVEPGFFVAQVHRPGTEFFGAGESFQSLGDAVRMAQLAFDARVVLALRRRARVVGQA